MVWQRQLQPPHNKENFLSKEFSIALLYHDIFDFPLREREVVKWSAGGALKLISARPRVQTRDGYYFLKGKDSVTERARKESVSRVKMKVVAQARQVLDKNPDILMVGITGSLAMAASKEESDVDFLIITKKGRLWGTRLRVLLTLIKHKVAVRRAEEKKEKDKLCLNIWMDETDMVIKHSRNAYTAHELAQTIPLINLDNTYEKLLAANRWILDYWPNVVAISNFQLPIFNQKLNPLSFLVEKCAYFLQKTYMTRKRTREIVTPTRAFFHPFDWSTKVIKELERRGVVDLGIAP
jgi:predicted nucleotidyltransferase